MPKSSNRESKKRPFFYIDQPQEQAIPTSKERPFVYKKSNTNTSERADKTEQKKPTKNEGNTTHKEEIDEEEGTLLDDKAEDDRNNGVSDKLEGDSKKRRPPETLVKEGDEEEDSLPKQRKRKPYAEQNVQERVDFISRLMRRAAPVCRCRSNGEDYYGLLGDVYENEFTLHLFMAPHMKTFRYEDVEEIDIERFS
ncbi:CotO family spore coat protein [Salsuginibacillus kocurii]|uniref:CotO family spore coat protein n=1 Tax=Salsuginibacillus kocurii TaxID=427078 RepID=UPI0003A705D9|nr:CotO family spore coat protein [Salsuginibacillus kocurii]